MPDHVRIVGLCTIEDVIEELIGEEILDDTDQALTPREQKVAQCDMWKTRGIWTYDPSDEAPTTRTSGMGGADVAGGARDGGGQGSIVLRGRPTARRRGCAGGVVLVSQDASEVHEHRQYRRRIRKCHTVHVSCVELCPQLSVHTDLQEARPGASIEPSPCGVTYVYVCSGVGLVGRGCVGHRLALEHPQYSTLTQ